MINLSALFLNLCLFLVLLVLFGLVPAVLVVCGLQLLLSFLT